MIATSETIRKRIVIERRDRTLRKRPKSSMSASKASIFAITAMVTQ